mmetsp:Transcript_29360/g.43306  ORF Transcript_29360/g.43306 Transcript_29360/m.43306 type:complete len:90 (-) Transcript_29360:734-1003(-)
MNSRTNCKSMEASKQKRSYYVYVPERKRKEVRRNGREVKEVIYFKTTKQDKKPASNHNRPQQISSYCYYYIDDTQKGDEIVKYDVNRPS